MVRELTLKELLRFYNPDTLIMEIADHRITVDLYREGSMFIIRRFENIIFSKHHYDECYRILKVLI